MSDEKTPIQRAEDAVCEAIIARSSRDSEPNPQAANPEDLGKLAHAVAEMKFGPQGGEKHEDSIERSSTDYHYTTHGGEDRKRPPTGFTGAGDKT